MILGNVELGINTVFTSLCDGTLCYYEAEDGLGLADVERFVERGPQQDGDTDAGFRLGARTVNLVLRLVGVGDSDLAATVDLDAKRARLFRLLRPRSRALQLRYTLASGAVRQLDVHLAAAIPLPSKDTVGLSVKAGVAFRANDPMFYDPTAQAVTFGLSVGGTGFTVPTAVPTPIGSSALNQVRTLINTGHVTAWPVIRIVGPVANPVLTQLTTGDVLDFTGTTIAAGDYYQLDLRTGAKTVVDSAGMNRIAQLSDSSALATWALLADDDAPLGANDVQFAGTGLSTASQVYLTWFNRYLGI